MRMNDAFPSKYLKAEDLEDGDLIVTISDAYFEEFTDPRTQRTDSKPILRFEGDDPKPLVLNKTNYKTISQTLGSDDTDDWVGKQIALYATEVESFGETVLGIRVKLRQPPAKAKASVPTARTASAKTAVKSDSQARKNALKTPAEIAAEAPDADEIPF